MLPEFVALDCAVVAPDPPEVATGLATIVTFPPAPPLESLMATLSPPMAMPGPSRLTAGPPGPATARASPPSPPSPPTAKIATRLDTRPVLPDCAFALDAAPQLAELLA